MIWLVVVFAYIGAIYLGFSFKPFRELHVLAWTPFVSSLFFVVAAACVAVFHLFKNQLQKVADFSTLLTILNLGFFALLFSTPMHIFAFTGYFYLVHIFAVKSPLKRAKLIGLALSLVPLLVSRSTKEIQFIGLSYITFRAFHMISDKERIGLPKLREFFLYLTFFPAVVAGPIDRFPRFKSDLDKGYSGLNPTNLSLGLSFVIFGLCQKYIFAEVIYRTYVHRAAAEIGSRLVDMYAYSAYLYFDFAGYSAMAMGLGYMFGILLPKNFDHPYLARNPQDFWRRFHITLGDWLKDYFFLPLYRAFSMWTFLPDSPLLKQNMALFLTFLLMGYWNGNQKQYLLCGTLFGIYSVIHNTYLYMVKRKQIPDLFAPLGFAGRILAIFTTLNAACFALYVFSGRLPF